MLFANHFGCKNSWGGSSGLSAGYIPSSAIFRRGRLWHQDGWRCGWSGSVRSSAGTRLLDWGNRTRFGWGDRSCIKPFIASVLVTHSRSMRPNKAELPIAWVKRKMLSKRKNIAALATITSIANERQPLIRKGYGGTSPGRLSLTNDECGLRFLQLFGSTALSHPPFSIDSWNSTVLITSVQSSPWVGLSFTCSFANACKNRLPDIPFGNVVDELHDDNCLPIRHHPNKQFFHHLSKAQGGR
jgi:hypothetical protein